MRSRNDSVQRGRTRRKGYREVDRWREERIGSKDREARSAGYLRSAGHDTVMRMITVNELERMAGHN